VRSSFPSIAPTAVGRGASGRRDRDPFPRAVDACSLLHAWDTEGGAPAANATPPAPPCVSTDALIEFEQSGGGARYRVNPSANNDLDDTSSLLQSRHQGSQVLDCCSEERPRGTRSPVAVREGHLSAERG
jgi:hypothetical protein